jgi:hypothetical protein
MLSITSGNIYNVAAVDSSAAASPELLAGNLAPR